jgi:hypothetical protein
MGMVLLGIVESHALFQMGSGRGHFSQPEYDRPQRQVGLQEERRVLGSLG